MNNLENHINEIRSYCLYAINGGTASSDINPKEKSSTEELAKLIINICDRMLLKVKEKCEWESVYIISPSYFVTKESALTYLFSRIQAEIKEGDKTIWRRPPTFVSNMDFETGDTKHKVTARFWRDSSERKSDFENLSFLVENKQ